MKNKLFATALLLTAGSACADPTIYFEAPYGHDYDTMSAKIRVDSMTKQKGFYWANTYTFYDGNRQGYIGIQPRPAGETNLAIFSAFGSGAKSTSPNCNSGADGGAGVSCRVAYEFVPGKVYTLQIAKEAGAETGFNKWRGTISDDQTGEKVTIGEYLTPVSWGMLWRKTTFFDEWFPFNGGPSDPAKRPCVPYAKVTAFNPVFSKAGKVTKTKVVSSRINAGQDKCAVAHGASNARLTLGTGSHSVENGIFTEQ